MSVDLKTSLFRARTLVGAGLLATFALADMALAQPWPSAPVRCTNEADCLANLEGLAWRTGDALTVRLEGGRIKMFQGDQQACTDHDADKCLSYELRAFLPAAHVYVVEWTTYEDRGGAVVSAKTGQSAVLGSLPEFSPKGQTFVSVDNDELNGRDYDVAIFSAGRGVLTEVFRYHTAASDPYEFWEFLGWDGDDRIRLKVTINMGTGGAFLVRETDAVRTGRGWKLNRPQTSTR
jgi:hypothetical protein